MPLTTPDLPLTMFRPLNTALRMRAPSAFDRLIDAVWRGLCVRGRKGIGTMQPDQVYWSCTLMTRIAQFTVIVCPDRLSK